MTINVPKMPFTLTQQDLDNLNNQSQQNVPAQTPIQQNNSQSKWNFTPNLDNPAANFVFGAGDAMRNTLAGGLNMIPGVNIPSAKSGQGLSYDAGNIAGNIGTFMGGGDVLDTIRALGEGIPIAGDALQYLGQSNLLPSALRRAIGSGLYGASSDENNRVHGGELGAGLSAAFDLLPPSLRAASEAVSPITQQFSHILSPDTYAEGIINNISSGKGLEESGKDIASKINSNYQDARDEGGELFDNLSDKYGNLKLFDNPVNSEYATLPDSIKNSYGRDSIGAHNDFIANPTLDNAIDLRRELQNNINIWQRKFKLSGLTPTEKSQLDDLSNAKGSLQSDMQNLFNVNQDAGDMFDNANINWQKNVIPYEQDNDIYKMATGEVKNPTNIASIFRNPEDSTVKVVQDLPDDMRNNIIYSAMGSPTAQKNAKNLMSAYNSLDQKGLSSYATPELQDSMNKLGKGLQTRDILNKILGAYLGSHIPFMPEEIGAIAGYQAAPFLNRLFTSTGPKLAQNASSSIPNGVNPYVRNAVLPNILQGVNRNGS